MTRYLVYDVFSEKPFGGNQLAVIPDATGLPEADLQRIAREFNFSETTFVFPPGDPANHAKVRIFTPTMEVPFAGHPVIGTAIALADSSGGPEEMTLELGVGPLRCQAAQGKAAFTTAVPLEIMAEPDFELVVSTLGLQSADIVTNTHVPTLATLGLPFTITELASREALARIEIDISKMRIGAAAHPASLDFAQFVYWVNGDEIHARMFAPLDNIPEDPATGSATATLAALRANITGEEQSFTLHQGEDMGRHSVIGVRTTNGAITISGAAKRTMEGQLVY
ncbi:MAG: PhzF family phenazine biosynthesis protein [Pseudomonadota bacterium]|nr:PhzF family phenazine biosynthesis protein [Pseudomonadota bacterium]